MAKVTIDEERREFLARIGREGGRKGGKRSLETMTKAARIARAYLAGKQGGAPRKIDHAKVIEMRNSGKQWQEIATELCISMPSVARILRAAGLQHKVPRRAIHRIGGIRNEASPGAAETPLVDDTAPLVQQLDPGPGVQYRLEQVPGSFGKPRYRFALIKN